MSPLSIVLLIGAAYGGWVIVALLRRKSTANLFLAALIFLVSLKLVPYILGFSGVYQRAPWLSYAPFELESGFGPLIFLYVLARTSKAVQRGWPLHFVPLAIEFTYYLIMFLQPLEFKGAWHGKVQVYVDQVDYWYGLASLGAYLFLSLKQTRAYQAFAENNLTQGDPQTIRFMRSILSTFGVLLLLRAFFNIWSMFVPRMSFDQSYLSYFWIAVVIFVLGTGALALDERLAPITEPTAPLKVPPEEPPAKDWGKVADLIESRCIATTAWQDPMLSLQSFAEKVGYSASYISKALNYGRNESFSAFINRHRIHEVTNMMKDPGESRDLLELAFECGFNSKASFNRIFKQVTGETPTQYRARYRSAS